jgi:hypothetical protein
MKNSMRKIARAGLGIGTTAVVFAPLAAAETGAPYKIIINGQDITVGPANEGGGVVGCLNAGNGGDQIDVRVEGARDMQDAFVTKTDPPRVVKVSLSYANTGMEYLSDPTQNQGQHIGATRRSRKPATPIRSPATSRPT